MGHGDAVKAVDTTMVLWDLLVEDLLVVMAEDALPAPPALPRLEALTVRPGKWS